MRASRLLVAVCAVLAYVVAAAAPARAGWIIEQVVTETGATSRQQLAFEIDRMKTLMLDASGQPRAAFIVDLGAGTITQVDYHERHYVTATIEEHVQVAERLRQLAVEQMAEAMKETRDSIKDLPPDEQKAIDAMLRAQMKQATAPECRGPRSELRKTGQRATIAGYPAVRYDLLADGKRESEVWIAPGITAWRELDPRKLQRFSGEMAKLSACRGGRSPHGLHGAANTARLAAEGFAVRTLILAAGTFQEVVSAEQRPVPVAEFEPPPGFERKPLALPR